MTPALDMESLRTTGVLDTVIKLASDPIPNIRFNVAKALEVLATGLASEPGGRELVASSVLPSLNKLKDDTDADVRFFAQRALSPSAGYLSVADAMTAVANAVGSGTYVPSSSAPAPAVASTISATAPAPSAASALPAPPPVQHDVNAMDTS